jgi:hypothetical protein
MEKMPMGQIENPEEARKAAMAEKPFRDAAREEGVSPEEKAVLDKVAEGKGEKVIADINKEKERKAFVGRETVNGVEIVVEWDNGYDDYVIYFPQIEIGEAASEKGVHDQVLRITRKPDVAKLVFDYARQLAKKEPDVYKIYKRVEDFSGDMQYDDEENEE